MLLYATISDIIKLVLADTKIPFFEKQEAQAISNALEEEIGVNVPELHEIPNLTVQTSAVSVFSKVSLATMAEANTKHSVLGLVTTHVHKGENQRAQSFPKLGARQYTCTFSLIV